MHTSADIEPRGTDTSLSAGALYWRAALLPVLRGGRRTRCALRAGDGACGWSEELVALDSTSYMHRM